MLTLPLPVRSILDPYKPFPLRRWEGLCQNPHSAEGQDRAPPGPRGLVLHAGGSVGPVLFSPSPLHGASTLPASPLAADSTLGWAYLPPHLCSVCDFRRSVEGSPYVTERAAKPQDRGSCKHWGLSSPGGPGRLHEMMFKGRLETCPTQCCPTETLCEPHVSLRAQWALKKC